MALSSAATAMATPVSQQRASQVAELYVSQQYDAPSGLKVKTIEALNDQLYLINFSPCGWALVSRDDCAEPIMGYSTEGSLSKSMPENMAFMMGEVAHSVEGRKIQGNLNRNWTRIENGTIMQSRAGEPVEALIQVNWNQGSPYNKYCPGTGNNQAVVGCVAVAMSQAMSVQKYPLKPQGQKSYTSGSYGKLSIDYDQEPAYDWDAILSGANDKDEVARLLYHAGVSVSMDYGSDGSGIPSNQVYRITNALQDTFGYSNDVEYTWRKNYTGDWEELLLNELYAGRALIYNAVDSQGGYGHSFNIDGYNGTKYHLNWGWGGYGNGYFAIDGLKDASMDMNYDSNHVVVTGVGAPNSALRKLDLSDHYVETGLPAGTAFCALLVNGEMANTGNYKVEVTGAYDQYSGYGVVPFEYSNGLLLTTRELTSADSEYYVRIVVTDKDSNTKLTQGFTVAVEAPQLIEHRTAMSYDRTSQMFTMKTKFGASYVVKNSQGTTVLSGTISSSPYFEFSRSALTSGTNTVEVTSGTETKTIKIQL